MDLVETVIQSNISSISMGLPLPKKKFQRRFSQVFEAFSRNQSVTSIGLPLSSRTAWIRYLMDSGLYKQLFYHKYVVIQLNAITSTYEDVVIHLSFLFLKHLELEGVYKTMMERAINEGDATKCLFVLEQILSDYSGPKIVLVVYNLERYGDETLDLFNTLWRIKRQPPKAPLLFWFVTLPSILLGNSSKLLPLTENVFVQTVLDTDELEFTRKRLEREAGIKISNTKHIDALQESRGFYLVYKRLVLSDSYVSDRDLQDIRGELSAAKLASLEGFELLLPEFKLIGGSEGLVGEVLFIHKYKEFELKLVVRLTAQKADLLDLFLENKNEVVSREKIAEFLWQKEWRNKYSDMAIDKYISEIRKAIGESVFAIQTVKGRGYKLVERV